MSEMPNFEPHLGETILYRANPGRQWYHIAWKVISGLIIVLVADLIVAGIVARLPEWVQFPLIGLVFLASLGYVIEDLVRLYVSDYVLTDQRFWTRGTPYAWSPAEDIPLVEIESLTHRRDAIFVRRKGKRKLLVYLFPDGKLLAQAYRQVAGKSVTPSRM